MIAVIMEAMNNLVCDGWLLIEGSKKPGDVAGLILLDGSMNIFKLQELQIAV